MEKRAHYIRWKIKSDEENKPKEEEQARKKGEKNGKRKIEEHAVYEEEEQQYRGGENCNVPKHPKMELRKTYNVSNQQRIVNGDTKEESCATNMKMDLKFKSLQNQKINEKAIHKTSKKRKEKDT